MLPLEELHKLLKENPTIAVNICDLDDTLIDVNQQLLNAQQTKRVLKSNIFAVATSRGDTVSDDVVNTLTPYIRETYTNKAILVGSKVRRNEWDVAQIQIFKSYLTGIISTIDLNSEANLPSVIKKIYDSLQDQGIIELTKADQVFKLIIEALASELKSKLTPKTYQRFLVELMQLRKEGIEPFNKKISDKCKPVDDSWKGIIRIGYNYFDPILNNLVIECNDTALLQHYIGLSLTAELKTTIYTYQSYFEDLKKAKQNSSQLIQYVQQQLIEVQQKYYNPHTKVAKLFMEFLQLLHEYKISKTENKQLMDVSKSSNSAQTMEQRVDALWLELEKEIKASKEACNMSSLKETIEFVCEASAYLNSQIFAKPAFKIDSADVKTYLKRLVTEQEAATIFHNFSNKLNNGVSRKQRETEKYSYSEAAQSAAQQNPITIEKMQHQLIITIDKNLPTEIKLTIANTTNLNYIDFAQNKMRHFLEICYQLRVIPDKTPDGIQLTGGANIIRINADRFIYIDDAKGPVNFARLLGMKSFVVITQPVLEARKKLLATMSDQIKRLSDYANEFNEAVIYNNSEKILCDGCILVGTIKKLFPILIDNFVKLLNSSPDECKEEILIATSLLLQLENKICAKGRITYENDKIEITHVTDLKNDIKTILEQFKKLFVNIANIGSILTRLENQYIENIKQHRNNYVCTLGQVKQTPGLMLVLNKVKPTQAVSTLSSIFGGSSSATVIKQLDESEFLLLQRYADDNNVDALEALGSYVSYHYKDIKRARACYQLAYVNCSDQLRLVELQNKVKESEIAYIDQTVIKTESESRAADKTYTTQISITSNADEIDKFNSIEQFFNNEIVIYGLVRLADIYFHMALADKVKNDFERFKYNCLKAYQYIEISFQLNHSDIEGFGKCVAQKRNEIFKLLPVEWVTQAYSNLSKWFSNSQIVTMLRTKEAFKSSLIYQEYMRQKSNDQLTFDQYLLRFYASKVGPQSEQVRSAASGNNSGGAASVAISVVPAEERQKSGAALLEKRI